MPPPLPDLKEVSAPERELIAIQVRGIMSSSLVQQVILEMREELVSPLSFGYERPTTSSFQRAVGWMDLPATPGSADVPFASAKHVGPHLKEACQLTSTPLTPTTTSARADLKGAVQWVAAWRGGHSGKGAVHMERQRKTARFHEWKRRLRGVDAQLESLRCPQSVACQGDGVSMALVACMGRAAGLPDTEFVANQVHGFPTVGDYPDSGCFRECYRPATKTFGELNHRKQIATVRAKLQEAGADPDPGRRFLLSEVTKATDDECAKGIAWGPFTEEQVNAILGEGKWHPLLGFGVVQGTRSDGSVKVRRCDDAAASGSNDCPTTYETIACEDASFPVTVISLLSEEIGPLEPMPACHHATDDVNAAYRRAMCASPLSTVVAIYHTGLDDVRFYLMPGHNFGLVTAVLTWNRFSFQAAALARRFYGVPCAPFFDDYNTCEPCYCGRSGKDALHQIHRWMGVPLDTGDKDVPFSSATPFLGVITDLSRVTEAWVTMRAKPERVGRIVASIERFLSSGIAPYGQVESLCGKLEYTLTSSCNMRFGRAALSALREYLKDSKRISDPMEVDHLNGPASQALHFFYQLLPLLPPRQFAFRKQQRKPVLVYTDASFTRWGAGVGMIGIVIIDLEDTSTVHVAGCVVPPHIISRFRPRTTYIGQLEALAAVLAYTSRPDLFVDREVIHFIDNTGALYGLHHGYSRDIDTSTVVHECYALLVAISCRTWWAYVPSAANIADYPSRLKWQDLAMALAAQFPHSAISNFTSEISWPSLSGDWAASFRHYDATYAPTRTRATHRAIAAVKQAVAAARRVEASISVRNSKKRAREQ